MKSYIKGNDLIVKWTVLLPDGEPFPLAGFGCGISFSTARGVTTVEDTADLSINGNELTWRFAADSQRDFGKYNLTMRLYRSGRLVTSIRKQNAFELTRFKGDRLGYLEITSYCENVFSSGGGGGSVEVIDNLESESTIDALSANQGRVLKGLIDDKQDIIEDLDTIRSGAELGASSIQDVSDLATKQELATEISARQNADQRFRSDLASVNGSIGNLADLTTSEKRSIVGAINEVNARAASGGGSSGGGSSVVVEDNLTSTSTVNALSANQGRLLNISVKEAKNAASTASSLASSAITKADDAAIVAEAAHGTANSAQNAANEALERLDIAAGRINGLEAKSSSWDQAVVDSKHANRIALDKFSYDATTDTITIPTNVKVTGNYEGNGYVSAGGTGSEGTSGGGGNSVSWGTGTRESVELTVESVTKSLSVAGHTHEELSKIGDLSLLQTANKGTLVAAINEINANGGSGSGEGGSGVVVIDDLKTQDSTYALSANQGFILKGLIDKNASAAKAAADAAEVAQNTANNANTMAGAISTRYESEVAPNLTRWNNSADASHTHHDFNALEKFEIDEATGKVRVLGAGLIIDGSVDSTGYISAGGTGASGSAGGGGTAVQWGTVTEGQSVGLSIEGESKILSLAGHTHDIDDVNGLSDEINNIKNDIAYNSETDLAYRTETDAHLSELEQKVNSMHTHANKDALDLFDYNSVSNELSIRSGVKFKVQGDMEANGYVSAGGTGIGDGTGTGGGTAVSWGVETSGESVALSVESEQKTISLSTHTHTEIAELQSKVNAQESSIGEHDARIAVTEEKLSIIDNNWNGVLGNTHTHVNKDALDIFRLDGTTITIPDGYNLSVGGYVSSNGQGTSDSTGSGGGSAVSWGDAIGSNAVNLTIEGDTKQVSVYGHTHAEIIELQNDLGGATATLSDAVQELSSVSTTLADNEAKWNTAYELRHEHANMAALNKLKLLNGVLSIPDDVLVKLEGNLEVGGYVSAGGTGIGDLGNAFMRTPVETSENTITLSADKYYIVSGTNVLTVNLPEGFASDCVMYCFDVLIPLDDFSLILPDGVRWVTADAPAFSGGSRIQVTILNGLMTFNEFYNVI